MEWRRRRIPGVGHPDGMAAEKNSGCETSGWNVGGGRIPDVRHPGGVSDDFRPGGMSYATRRKGASACPMEREPRDNF